MLRLYCLFHLNLMYSSIERESRPKVIEKCYWPLLRLAADTGVPLAIELSGYTLEQINDIDREWVEQFVDLIAAGKVELVGSGYAQIIGPLAPAEVNAWNQKLGVHVYRKVLGVSPEIALINEMAYSSGLIEHYLDSGYEAIMMEWNNPRRVHPEWDDSWRYFPQRALTPDERSVPVIWLDCIAFQKFQRYAHGEDSLKEYLTYLEQHRCSTTRYFPLYGNDAEIFDFRPGRYPTESEFYENGEWARIRKLFLRLQKQSDFDLIFPSEVLSGASSSEAGHELHLESTEQPVPVKKQEKYNLTRWAVTGRDDLNINTRCYRIYETLLARDERNPEIRKELCTLWSSDFRTHITAKRWQAFRSHLERFYKKQRRQMNRSLIWPSQPRSLAKKHIFLSEGVPAERVPLPPCAQKTLGEAPSGSDLGFFGQAPRPIQGKSPFDVSQTNKYLTVATDRLKVVFNLFRGLAIESFTDTSVSEQPLFGTLEHGYYRNIGFGADFYSGHTVIEIPGKKRITDLVRVQPEVYTEAAQIEIKSNIDLGVGEMEKCWTLSLGPPQIKLSMRVKLENQFYGAIRTGYLTLLPSGFQMESLFYGARNGGRLTERFALDGRPVQHDLPVSALISARHGLGCTDGAFELGDRRTKIRIVVDRAVCAALPMMRYEKVDDAFFCRVLYSLLEIDETRASFETDAIERQFEQTISVISAKVKHEP
ncbi:MAG: glycoside hydrolase family 57 [bacterium]